MKYQEQKVAQQERLQRRVKRDYDKGDFCWTETCEVLARRVLKYLEDTESTKVCIRTKGQHRAHRKAS